jgi:hypothetical protein
MPDNLARDKQRASRRGGRTAGARKAGVSVTVPRMPKKPPSELQINLSNRLRAVQDEPGLNDTEMGEMIGIGRTRWGNWTRYENKPSEEGVIQLCEKTGVGMEWLYRGRAGDMPMRLFIRLEMRLKGIDPDKSSKPEKALVVAALALASADL